MFSLLALACTSNLTIGSTPDGKNPFDKPDDDSVEQAPGDTASDTAADSGDPVESEFFDDSFIHEIEITLSPDAKTALRREPYEFTEGSITVDGAFFDRVGVRLRGKIGSFRTLTGKPKFKIDFNLYESEQRLGVYKALALNNEVVDCSYLREPAGYEVLRQIGVPVPRTVFTHVTVNGDDYGMYVGLEYPDDVFLASRYSDPSGNLYDGKYVYYDNGSYQLIDFTPELVEYFSLEEGTDVANADVEAIADNVNGAGAFEYKFADLVDIETFHRHLAGEQWIGHIDGYALNTNNYRVYFDPTDGRADLLAYDLDYAFLSAGGWGMSWGAPRGILVQNCWSDAACVAAQQGAVLAALGVVDTAAILDKIDTWRDLTADAIADDPRRECNSNQVASEQANVRAWIASAPNDMATYWSVDR